MNKIIGIFMVILGMAIAIVPNFTDCASHGAYMTVMGKQMPMVCHWSARAEIVMGIPLVFMGAIMSFTRNKNSILVLSLLGMVLGILVIVLPTNIIGTCGSPTMTCNTLMKPAALLLGSLTIAASLGGLIWAARSK